MELAKVYEDITEDSCFKMENVFKYVTFLETYIANTEKEHLAIQSCDQQGVYTFY